MRSFAAFRPQPKTKKTLAILLLLILALITPGRPTMASTIQIYIDGQLLDSSVEPQLIEGRTFLPLRACSEALSASVEYDSAAKRITIIHAGTEIQLTVGQTQATINGQAYTIDAQPFLYQDFTLVPVRFVSEALNCLVEWEAQTSSVMIYTDADSGVQTAQPTLTWDEKIPQTDTIAIEAVQQINNIRQQKKLETFVTLGELTEIAEAHNHDMISNGYFATQSPSQGSPAKRAQAYNLQPVSEVIAKVNYDVSTLSAVITAWMNDPATNAILLNPSASFIGISAYRPQDSSVVYLTAEVLPSRAYFIEQPAHSETSTGLLTLNGRSTAKTETINIYKLSAQNSNMYTEKRQQTATVNNTYFFTDIELWAPGNYAINVADCTVYVTYK